VSSGNFEDSLNMTIRIRMKYFLNESCIFKKWFYSTAAAAYKIFREFRFEVFFLMKTDIDELIKL